MEAICGKCHNREKCRRPCWFVETLLARVTDGSLEKQTSDNTLMHFGHHWEKRFSDIHDATLKKIIAQIADEQTKEDREPDNRRADDIEFSAKQNIADIFYMRFFQGKSYVEIGQKYKVDHKRAASLYSHALKRVNAILEALDGRDRAIKCCMDRQRNSLTKHQKAFLLNKVFGFAFVEIAELLGYAGPDAIRHKVNEMYRQYRTEYFPEKKPFRSMYEDMTPEQIHARITCT